ncbi:glycosyltransferase [Sporofaciens musculi]|uniref:glycosyltransferase n=1 Tax=Sporofaciens musculi TaxID=2681861 RepID=UPI00258B52F1|nr:glycosyltransferase [Sporofaciens musculi]
MKQKEIGKLPPFSVAMCVYAGDNAEWFGEALQSITLKQTVRPDEIVIVVDGPVPKTIKNVIHKYMEISVQESFCLKPVWLEKNRGLGNALKIAVSQCQYEIIARMDSDDIARRSRFKTQLEILDLNPHIDVVGGDISEFIGDKQNVVGKRTLPVTDKEIKRYAKKRCPFNHMTVMYRKAAVMKAGGYQDWFWNEDYYLWIRMQERGMVFANTGTVLVDVRVGEEMYRRRGGWKYYKSEIRLQKYMLDHRVISYGVYMMNCSKRFIVQVLMTSRMREWTYKALIRS